MKKAKRKRSFYTIPETVYISKVQSEKITNTMNALGYPSRSSLLRHALDIGIKDLNPFL